MQFLHSLKVLEIDPNTLDLFMVMVMVMVCLHWDRDEFWCFTTFQLNSGYAVDVVQVGAILWMLC